MEDNNLQNSSMHEYIKDKMSRVPKPILKTKWDRIKDYILDGDFYLVLAGMIIGFIIGATATVFIK